MLRNRVLKIAFFAIAACAILFAPILAMAAQVGVDVVGTLEQAWTAYRNHAYVLAGAVVVGLVISLLKAGWLNKWLAARIPSKALPWVAVGVGVLGMIATSIVNGMTWQQAVLHGIEAAALAVFGHQTLVEGLRDGQEFVPSRLPLPTIQMSPPQGPGPHSSS